MSISGALSCRGRELVEMIKHNVFGCHFVEMMKPNLFGCHLVEMIIYVMSLVVTLCK